MFKFEMICSSHWTKKNPSETEIYYFYSGKKINRPIFNAIVCFTLMNQISLMKMASIVRTKKSNLSDSFFSSLFFQMLKGMR